MEEIQEEKKSWVLFVYGTLRKGFSNHALLEGATYLGPSSTKEKYALFVDGIPYVTRENPVSKIYGEVYEIDDRTLGLIDRLEDHSNWYERQTVEVTLENGTTLGAWLYFNEHPRGMLVESGDFAQISRKEGL